MIKVSHAGSLSYALRGSIGVST